MTDFPRANILVSHAFMRNNQQFLDLILGLSPYVNIMVDSGAFTNFQKKQAGKAEPISLEEYLTACKTLYHNRVWQYVMLDVIMDKKKTSDNLKTMLDAGLKPMPVLTPTADVKEIESLIKVNRRISISGGAVGVEDKKMLRRFKQIYKMTDGNVLMHGLGYTRYPDVLYLPLATVDSTSMKSGARYGSILTYSTVEGMQSVNWRDFEDTKKKRTQKVLGRLLKYGIPMSAMKDPDQYKTGRRLTSFSGFYAFLLFAIDCHKKNTAMFFSLSSMSWLLLLASTYANATPRSFNLLKAEKQLDDMIQLMKDKPEQCFDIVVDIFKKNTDWQTNKYTDDQYV